MPAATTQSDLIAVTQKEFTKLDALMAKVPQSLAMEKDADDTSIKDVIGHRAHWIDLFFTWYEQGQTGAEVPTPAPGYKWNQLKSYNAKLRADQADLGWDAACTMLRTRHAKLVEFMQAHDDQALYGGPMPGPASPWTTGRWAEASGPSHYRSAAKYIRARLKEAGIPK